MRDMISLVTAFAIMDDPEVYVSAPGPMEGKYALYVGTWDETPSGCKRPRHLFSSAPVYDSPEAAKEAGEKLVADIRQCPRPLGFDAKEKLKFKQERIR